MIFSSLNRVLLFIICNCLFISCKSKSPQLDNQFIIEYSINHTLYFDQLKQIQIEVNLPNSIASRQIILSQNIYPTSQLDTLNNAEIIAKYRFFNVKDSINIKISGQALLQDSQPIFMEPIRKNLSSNAPESSIDSASQWIIDSIASYCKNLNSDSIRATCVVKQVNDYLTYELQNYELALPQILANHKGDCTEFSFLTHEICKSLKGNSIIHSGLHLRAITPLTHSWNECQFSKNGIWFLLDATWYSESSNFSPLQRNPYYFIISQEFSTNKKWIQYKSDNPNVRLKSSFSINRIND